jgi:alanine racemase
MHILPLPHFTTSRPSSWVEISEEAFNHNVKIYRELSNPAAKIFIVAKSNAYGHGLQPIGQLSQKNQAIDGLCVFLLSDALLLRAQGFTKKILVIGHIDAPLEEAINKDIHLICYTLAFAQHLNDLANQLNKKAYIHIKIDTGLSRLGFLPEDAIENIEKIHREFDAVSIYGIFSHFAESDAQDLTFTKEQIQKFERVLEQLNEIDIHPLAVHLNNSTGTIRIPSTHYTMVRVGGGIWGIAKSDKIKAEVRKRFPHFYLRPILNWKTSFMSLKWVPEGSSVSYACTYKTEGKTLLGIIPVGYFDGYPRALSNKSVVLVDGKIAPIRGRVAMNMCIIDVTDIPNVSYESSVTIIGEHPLINVEYLASQMNSISYDILVGIHPSLPRKIVT